MYFPPVGYLDPVKAVELRDQGIRIFLDMCVVFTQYPSEELVFGVVDGLDNVFVVSREVEEAAAFAWRTKLREYIFARQRHQVVRRV